ncbi:MAG: tRNA (adenosine(37)-N6)-dimethylallyltransferase MiaA [Firmicutes bacterium]|nr:tRNA (adenosine(37)-N6)-dimethylallyltransferase MiaA [Bacillota bacterium]
MVSSQNKPRLLIIVGPTAVGKTATSLEVARLVDGEIISADSMQVYRGMDIGTSKVTPEEAQGIRHYLIDVRDPGEPFSVAQYVQLADEAIAEIQARGKTPVVVGGTGLYIRALVDGLLFEDSGANHSLRKELQEYAAEHGRKALHRRLAEIDPESAERIHPNDLRRVVRALEVYYTTGETMSQKIAKSKLAPPRYQGEFYGLYAPRDLLYARINQRVNQMVASGLVWEVMQLLAKGFTSYLTSNQAIGYKEIVQYLSGEMTFKEAVDDLKKATRNYAKRQLSWFRADPRIHWYDVTAYSSLRDLAKAIVYHFEKGNSGN